MSGWSRGAVAMVSAANRPEPYPASYDGTTWRSLDGGFCVDQPTSHRPLVVIDPESREQVRRLALAINIQYGSSAVEPVEVARVQAALRSLVTEPRPEEPQGLGAVVEDAEGLNWVRVAGGRYGWVLANMMSQFEVDEFDGTLYDSIAAVRVLSEGVAR